MKSKSERGPKNGVFWAAFVFFFTAVCCRAAPPMLDMAPAFGDAYYPGKWQTVNVTATNPADGEAFQGEVQVALENKATLLRAAAYARAMALPKGAGKVTVPVTLYLPDLHGMERLHLYLVAPPDKGGGVLTQREFDNPLLRRRQRTIVAVQEANVTGPLAIAPLDGAILEPAAPKQGRPEAVIYHLARAADPGNLPDRAAGYDAAEIVYLGPDVAPAAFSDAQTDALRGFVTGGGLLVALSSDKLREDERFRPWMPPNDAVRARTVGRGRVLSGKGVMTELTRGDTLNTLALWRRILRRELPPPSVGRVAADDEGYGYNSFANSVLSVPGVAAPELGTIAGFLTAYLVLLVPVNYFLLKRLDRREWAWVTVPALAALFSAGAFAVSFAGKAGQKRVNVATIAEMGAGNGTALAHAAIGLYSPVRAAYDISVDLPDAVLWQPTLGFGRSGGPTDGGPPLFVEREGTGMVARNVAVPMWGVGVVAAKTVTAKMGDGVTIEAVRSGERLSGKVTNRTGAALMNVVIRLGDKGQRIGDLAAGQSVPFAFRVGQRGDRLSQEAGFKNEPDYHEPATPESVRRRIAAALSRAAYEGVGPDFPSNALTLTAWSAAPILPIRVDGNPAPEGDHVALIFVTAPKP